MYSVSNVFTSAYWLDMHPVLYSNTLTFQIFLYGFLVMLVLGIVLKIILRYKGGNMMKAKKNLYLDFGGTLMIAGFLGLLWGVLRYENVYVLSMRFWAVILLLWFVFNIYSAVKVYQYQMERINGLKSQKADLYKYMPKKK